MVNYLQLSKTGHSWALNIFSLFCITLDLYSKAVNHLGVMHTPLSLLSSSSKTVCFKIIYCLLRAPIATPITIQSPNTVLLFYSHFYRIELIHATACAHVSPELLMTASPVQAAVCRIYKCF